MQLFNPAYGMFTVDEESSSCWFSSNMMAGVVPFELIGIICGLAIHNAVLMPVNFPLLLFKKLLEWPANTLQDLFSLHPQVARYSTSLAELLASCGSGSLLERAPIYWFACSYSYISACLYVLLLVCSFPLFNCSHSCQVVRLLVRLLGGQLVE